MRAESRRGRRARVEASEHRLSVVVAFPHTIWTIPVWLVVSGFLLAWVAAGVYALPRAAYAGESDFDLVFVAALVVWALLGAVVAWAWLLVTCGHERVTVTHEAVVFHAEPVGVPRRFRLPELQDVCARREPHLMPWPTRGWTVLFDFGWRTFCFGRDLDEAEARRIAEVLRKQCGLPPARGASPTP